MNDATSVKSAWDPTTGLLRGRRIFLSASVPSLARSKDFQRLPDAQREIEFAIISLARAIFAQGGRIEFGGHPSISPLISLVAGEYVRHGAPESPRPIAADGGDPPVIIHQLDVFRPVVPDATMLMERLGQARIRWWETDPQERARKEWPPDAPKYPKSLRRMREGMLIADRAARDDYITMVCIGGMEGVLEEAEIFAASPRRRASRQLIAFARTGGAAAILAERPALTVGDRAPLQIMAYDVGYLDHAPPPRLDRGFDQARLARFTPYPAICSALVQFLIRTLGI